MADEVVTPMTVPRYLRRFQCLGSVCHDSCCTGTRVVVDASTLQRLSEIKTGPLASLVRVNLKAGNGANDVEAAELLQPGGQCAMLDRQGFCQVHSRLGKRGLPDVCYDFPQRTRQFAGRIEQTLTMACPEAARLALTATDAFEIETASIAVREHQIMPDSPVAALTDQERLDLRTCVMTVLRDDRMNLPSRMITLGLLCEEIENVIAFGRAPSTKATLALLRESVRSGALAPLQRSVTRDIALQVELFAGPLLTLARRRTVRSRQDVFELVQRGLTAGAGAGRPGGASPSAGVLAQCYESGLALAGSDRTADTVLSRFFLNQALRENFPWGDAGPLRHFRRWAGQYGLLRAMWAAVANARGRPADKSEAVHIVQVFARQFERDWAGDVQLANTVTRCDGELLPRLLSALR